MKPCPFCGGEAKWCIPEPIYSLPEQRWLVSLLCAGCGVWIEESIDTLENIEDAKKKLSKRWNRRPE